MVQLHSKKQSYTFKRYLEMIKKFHILLLLLLIGFFIQPIQAYACGTHSVKTEKSCCATSKDNVQDNSQEKQCCQKHTSTKNDTEKECDNTCNSNSCHCSTSCQSIGFLSIVEVKIIFFVKNPFSDLDIEKEKINYNENFLSSGFLSLWLPPKIA